MVKEQWWPELKLPPINLWSLPPWQTFSEQQEEKKPSIATTGEKNESNEE